jgi:ArsR family transcriptional regulator, cadmium/lead-responsive transcriptional repressor
MGLDRMEIDNKILDELHDGRNVPSNLAESLGVTRQYVGQRLKLLEAADHVRNVGRGVYELVDDPRKDIELDLSTSPEYVRQLEKRNQYLENKISRLREQTGTDVDVTAVCNDLERALKNNEWGAVEDAAARLGCEFE